MLDSVQLSLLCPSCAKLNVSTQRICLSIVSIEMFLVLLVGNRGLALMITEVLLAEYRNIAGVLKREVS